MAGRNWIYRRPPGLERLTKHLNPALYVHVHAWTQIANPDPASWMLVRQTISFTIVEFTPARNIAISDFVVSFGLEIAEMIAPPWVQIANPAGTSWTQVANP